MEPQFGWFSILVSVGCYCRRVSKTVVFGTLPAHLPKEALLRIFIHHCYLVCRVLRSKRYSYSFSDSFLGR
jgi:hypothetical protein